MSEPQTSVRETVDQLVQDFALQPHPEGGFYRETYRAPQGVQTSAGQTRSASTAIYYLLAGSAYSAWHRIASDEIWHFYAGSLLDVHVLCQQQGLVTHRLGNALQNRGTVFQAVVPAGCWFAAELAHPDTYAFVGCTVAPGFEFSEFELANAADLLQHCPEHSSVIRRLLSAA